MEMTKLVINTCYGGFGLSDEGWKLYAKYKNYYTREVNDVFGRSIDVCPNDKFDNNEIIYNHDLVRNDPDLVRVVEELGIAAGDNYAELKVIEIPDDVIWELNEYDGREWIAETHRRWS
jgi:hypothetical protein